MSELQNPISGAPQYEEYRKSTERANQLYYAAQENKEALRKFLGDADLWRSNARHAQTALAKEFGYVLGPKPPIPMEKVFNEAKFDDFWTRRHHNGEELPDDFFVDRRPMVFKVDPFDITPPPNPNTPKQNTGKPVGEKDPITGKGWFLFVLGSVKSDGSAYERGDVWTDPATDIDYELREFVRRSPFNPGAKSFRWALIGIARPSPDLA